MNPRPLLIVGGVIVVVMLAVSAVAWPQIPDDAQVPIRWGLGGEPDGFGPKWVALLLLPALLVPLTALLAFIPSIDPRRDNLERSMPAYVAIVGTALAFLGAVHVGIVWSALGNDLDIGRIVGIGVGLLFVVIGNFLGKTRSNWFMGIRTPWTLSSERSWTRTHRLGGRLFVLVGVLAAVVSLAGVLPLLLGVVLGGTTIMVVVLFAYSYLVWRDDPDRASAGAHRAEGD